MRSELQSTLMQCGNVELVSSADGATHALVVLTGASVRPNQDDWIAWWNDNKRGLELTKQEQELDTKKGRSAWMELWATPEDKELMELARKQGKDGFGDATPGMLGGGGGGDGRLHWMRFVAPPV